MTTATDAVIGSLNWFVVSEVRAELARHRWTGRELARQLGVSHAWVSRRLDNQVPISVDELERIASQMGVDTVEILTAAVRARRRAETHPTDGATLGYSVPWSGGFGGLSLVPSLPRIYDDVVGTNRSCGERGEQPNVGHSSGTVNDAHAA